MKKFKVEYLLYLFVVITPFLDVIACLFRDFFPNSVISPATIIRPIIPIILFMYIMIKDKNVRKYLVISGVVMLLYGGIHLLIYKEILTGISFGGVISEAQYIINYTYMVYVLFIFMYFMKRRGLPYLNKALFIMLCGYLILLYISIITGTSYPTYVEGIGYRGWFVSGNSLSTILIMGMCVFIDSLFKKRKIFNYVLFFLLGIYLLFLVGTRTGMIGFILVLSIYLFGSIIVRFVKEHKVSVKKIVSMILILVVISGGVLIVGSSTLERRKHLESENTGIMDINTGEAGYTTGDTSTIVYQIRNNTIDSDYLSEAQKKAYISMYEYANDNKIDSSNRRLQQLIYHINLVKYQHNILYILFGNGYLSSYGEMVLEMEIPAILFNLGIVGFLLYLGPFVGVFVYVIKRIKVSKREISMGIVMKVVSLLLAILLSCMAGYVFFSVSCVLLMICILSLLYGEGEIK